MASLLYKDYLIVVFANFDAATQLWIPQAISSWETGGRRELHTITNSRKHFPDRESAEKFAVEMAKAWIDSRP